MTEAELEHRLTDVESRSKSNQHRIDDLEQTQETIARLATSMEVMATETKHISTKVDTLDGKVEALEAKPGKKYDSLAEKALWAVLGAVIAFVMKTIGII